MKPLNKLLNDKSRGHKRPRFRRYKAESNRYSTARQLWPWPMPKTRTLNFIYQAELNNPTVGGHSLKETTLSHLGQ